MSHKYHSLLVNPDMDIAGTLLCPDGREAYDQSRGLYCDAAERSQRFRSLSGEDSGIRPQVNPFREFYQSQKNLAIGQRPKKRSPFEW